jgi:hypothetical protein
MYVLLIVVCLFVLFLLAILLSVLLRFTDPDYPFGIFKLFYYLFSLYTEHLDGVLARGIVLSVDNVLVKTKET